MSCTGICQELRIRSKIGDCGLQATAVEEKMNPYPDCSFENQTMAKEKSWKAGRHSFTYVDLLKQDTGLEEPRRKYSNVG